MQPVKWQLHRSVIFWSGILVMFFGLWCWSKSSGKCFRVQDGPWQMDHWAGGVAISHMSPRPSSWEAVTWSTGNMDSLLNLLEPEQAYHTHRALMVPLRRARPGFYRFSGQRELQVAWDEVVAGKAGMDPALYLHCLQGYMAGTGPSHVLGMGTTRSQGWILFVPHWLLLAGFAALWIVALAWRRRRGRVRNAE